MKGNFDLECHHIRSSNGNLPNYHMDNRKKKTDLAEVFINILSSFKMTKRL